MTWAWDGWARYECRIETRERRGKTKWRYVIEREFVTTDVYKTGWWSSDRDKVLARAERQRRRLAKVDAPDGAEYLAIQPRKGESVEASRV